MEEFFFVMTFFFAQFHSFETPADTDAEVTKKREKLCGEAGGLERSVGHSA